MILNQNDIYLRILLESVSRSFTNTSQKDYFVLFLYYQRETFSLGEILSNTINIRLDPVRRFVDSKSALTHQ